MAETTGSVDDEKAAPTGGATAGGMKPIHLLLPLALAQFINAYDTTAMNVAVSKVVTNLHTTVSGVQAALTIYSLVMAACMITGSKLGDVWGRKRTLAIGVVTYGVGALITALSVGLGMMTIGWSILEGVGSALMIPAIFALVGSMLPTGKDRLKGYAIIGSAAAAGAALGPLLMGFWATLGAWTWRLSFFSEVLVVLIVLVLMKRMGKVPVADRKPKLDTLGAILSAVGLALIVLGVLLAGAFGWVHSRIDVKIGNTVMIHAGGLSPVIPLVVSGIVILVFFVLWQRHMTNRKKEPLIELSIFKSRAAYIGLPVVLMMMFMQAGMLFVVPVFLQMSIGLSPILCGLAILPLTVFLIIFSQFTSKLTKRFSPKGLVMTGMALVPIGLLLIWALLDYRPDWWQVLPGLTIVGIGIGLANAPLLNTVQSSVPTEKQSEISGVNRAFSNLGGSFGTAIAGAVLMSVLITSMWTLVDGNSYIKANVTPKHLQEFKIALNKDAQAVGNAQAKAFFDKLARKARTISQTVATKLAQKMVTINQDSRNKALLAALLAVGAIGILGFFLSLFLPKIPPSKEEDGEDAAQAPDKGKTAA